MPGKNCLKTYQENGYYHIYSRGVNKNPIFVDEVDYRFFLYLLKLYLMNPQNTTKLIKQESKKFMRIPKNYYQKLIIICYCLMPNHIHLLVKQTEKMIMAEFMKAMMTKYVMYFNRKYKRTGHLFESRYKAAIIDSDPYLLHLTRYIHLNPQDLNSEEVKFSKTWSSFKDYPYSSYQWYLKKVKTEWFDSSCILIFFKNKSKILFLPKSIFSYQSFVENYNQAPPRDLKYLLID